jgi:glutamate synthase domain-containing protein 1
MPNTDKCDSDTCEEDYVIDAVMTINATVDGAFIFSSGKNMGAFKAVGYPEDVGEFYRLDEYEGYTWIGHGRFPTNTPGWWGALAVAFSIRPGSQWGDFVFGINKRYLESFGYKCTMYRYRGRLCVRSFVENASRSRLLADAVAPYWAYRSHEEKTIRWRRFTGVRIVYSSILLNGPFAFCGHANGMIG